jgi:hypothetical protein
VALCASREDERETSEANSPRPLTWGFGARREGFEPPTARSVAWCSASIWSAPDGSDLLMLEASSIWSDPDRSRRIVWMIKRMIRQGGQLGRAWSRGHDSSHVI